MYEIIHELYNLKRQRVSHVLNNNCDIDKLHDR